MRILLAVIVIFTALWGGYWFYGSQRAEQAAVDWFATAPERGLYATHDGISVAGFPNRFDITVTSPEVLDNRGLGWRAPFVQVFALSYRPNHVIVTWPNEQEILQPGGTAMLQSSRMQASAVFADAFRSLQRGTLVAEGLDYAGPQGAFGFDNGQLAVRALASAPGSYEVALNIAGLRPELPALPEGEAATLVLDGRAQVGPDGRPQSLEVQNLHLGFADMQLAGQGQLELDAQGLLNGQLDLSTADWQRMLALTVEAGLVDPEVAPTYENAMRLLAESTGTLRAPVTFNEGMMRLGPLPLGVVPQVRF